MILRPPPLNPVRLAWLGGGKGASGHVPHGIGFTHYRRRRPTMAGTNTAYLRCRDMTKMPTVNPLDIGRRFVKYRLESLELCTFEGPALGEDSATESAVNSLGYGRRDPWERAGRGRETDQGTTNKVVAGLGSQRSKYEGSREPRSP